MGFMAIEYFRHSPLLAFPLIALAVFMLVFAIVTVRTLLTKQTRWDEAARLPLWEETPTAGDDHE